MTGNVQPGQHAFPFSFVLPPGLPGTFEFHVGSTTARISYRIRGKTLVKGVFSFNLRSEQFMYVAERFPTQYIAPQAVDTQSEINCCCCISQGTASAQAQSDKVSPHVAQGAC
jgi:hypothetical protein